MSKKDIWDPKEPVEVSTYVNNGDITLFNNPVIPKTDKPKMIDLFSGAGGFSVGAEMAGFQTILGIDHFRPAIETWSENHPDAYSVLGDIKKIDITKIKEMLLRQGIEDIDLITAGVPCQGFSISNRKRNSDDERNFLFIEFMRFVEELKPKYIVLENVSGMRSTANGKFVEEIESFMEKLGYNVSIDLLNAADYGVPQIRKRLIFVGIRNDIAKNNKYSFQEGKFIGRYRTVYDAISDLPKINSNEESDSYDSLPITDYQKMMRSQNETLYNHVAPKHTKQTINRIKNTIPGTPMYEKFKQRIRLSYDKPSPTQLAGGIRPQYQFGHPTLNRGLTIRERARIQSFPDSFVFKGGTVQERVQTGNAIPPLLAYEVIKPLFDIYRKQ